MSKRMGAIFERGHDLGAKTRTSTFREWRLFGASIPLPIEQKCHCELRGRGNTIGDTTKGTVFQRARCHLGRQQLQEYTMRITPAPLALFALAGTVSFADSVTVPKPGRIHGPAIIHQRHGHLVTSTNWSGYAVTGAKGSVSDVRASWVVPSISGSCPSTDQYSSFWVGIDGYSSSTVEQVGTDSDCQNGTPVYYAWFEFYPHPSFTINSVPISPGNVVSAEVQSNGKGQFTVKLTNLSTGQSFSTSAKVPQAAQSSAEWIAEAPYSGGILPLGDFNSIFFGSDHTGQTNTCFATIGQATGPIGLATFNPNLDQITMDTTGGTIKAAPSSLSADGTSFSIAWLSPGP